MTTVLFVVSAADGWTLKDGTVHPTGYWAEELAEPHRLFTEAGWEITVATPGGVAPTLDEISLGLAPIAVREIDARLPEVAAQGAAIVIVEQDVAQALAAADRVTCLREGRVVLEGAAGALTREAITSAYFGV